MELRSFLNHNPCGRVLILAVFGVFEKKRITSLISYKAELIFDALGRLGGLCNIRTGICIPS